MTGDSETPPVPGEQKVPWQTGRVAMICFAAALMLGLNFWLERNRSVSVTAPVGLSPVARDPAQTPSRDAPPSQRSTPGSTARLCYTEPVAAVRIVRLDQGGVDTYFGDAYVREGAPSSPTLSFGGWGDHYYAYLRFVLPAGTAASHAFLCLYVEDLPANDPGLWVNVVTEAWDVRTLSVGRQPGSSFAKTAGRLQAGWNAIDVTPIVALWLSGSAANNGLMLSAAKNDHTNGSFASSKNPDVDKRPRLILLP